MAPTKDRILDAAERLFAANGFAATSLRNITSEAGANLAAVNYHFGSKEALLVAVIERRIGPINELRLQMLDAAEAEAVDGPLELETVLRALLMPLLDNGRLLVRGYGPFLQLAGRMHFESDENVRRIFMNIFQEVRKRFLAAFERALPELPAGEIFLRVHFLVGAMAHTLIWHHSLVKEEALPHLDLDMKSTIDKLISFAMAGMKAPLEVSQTGDRP
jgi:AcrR family transcriptional regulator